MQDAETKPSEPQKLFLTLVCFVFTGKWDGRCVSRSSHNRAWSGDFSHWISGCKQILTLGKFGQKWNISKPEPRSLPGAQLPGTRPLASHRCMRPTGVWQGRSRCPPPPLLPGASMPQLCLFTDWCHFPVKVTLGFLTSPLIVTTAHNREVTGHSHTARPAQAVPPHTVKLSHFLSRLTSKSTWE